MSHLGAELPAQGYGKMGSGRQDYYTGSNDFFPVPQGESSPGAPFTRLRRVYPPQEGLPASDAEYRFLTGNADPFLPGLKLVQLKGATSISPTTSSLMIGCRVTEP